MKPQIDMVARDNNDKNDKNILIIQNKTMLTVTIGNNYVEYYIIRWKQTQFPIGYYKCKNGLAFKAEIRAGTNAVGKNYG